MMTSPRKVNQLLSESKEKSKTNENKSSHHNTTIETKTIPFKQAAAFLRNHFFDRSKSTIDKFQKTANNTASSVGYIAENIESKKTFMLKEAKIKHLPNDLPLTFVSEFVMAPLYRRMLNNRAPLVEITEDPQHILPFLIRSKFLETFETVAELTQGEKQNLMGIASYKLQGVKGFEKLLAAALVACDLDLHCGNIGVMNINDNANPPELVFAKIDHGFSVANFFTDPMIMFTYLYTANQHFYNNKIPVNAYLLENALRNMLTISSDEIEKIIKNRLDELRKSGLEIERVLVNYYKDNLVIGKDLEAYDLLGLSKEDKKKIAMTRQQLQTCSEKLKNPNLKSEEKEKLEKEYHQLSQIIKNSVKLHFSILEQYYIDHLKSQFAIAQQLTAILNIVINIDRPDKENWLSSGRWLLDLKGEDPLKWAKDNGYTIRGRKPDQLNLKLIYTKGLDAVLMNDAKSDSFLEMIKTADKKTILSTLEKNIDLQSLTAEGESVIILALKRGDKDIIAKLLTKIDSLNEKDKVAVGKILVNSQLSDSEMIEWFAIKGANLNQQNKNGDTLLMLAWQESNWHLVHSLINLGADVTIKNKEQYTLLRYISENPARDWNIVKLIMEKSPKLSNDFLVNILFTAAQSKQMKIIHLLKDKNLINAKNENNETALMLAAKEADYEVLGLLAKLGADLNVTDKEGSNILLLALESESEIINIIRTIRLAVKLGIDVNATAQDGATAVMLAVTTGEEILLKALIDLKANLNIQDKNGSTALHYAVHAPKMIVALVAAGADVNAKDKDGKTIFDLLSKMKQTNEVKQMCKYLLSKGAGHSKDDKNPQAMDEKEVNNNLGMKRQR